MSWTDMGDKNDEDDDEGSDADDFSKLDIRKYNFFMQPVTVTFAVEDLKLSLYTMNQSPKGQESIRALRSFQWTLPCPYLHVKMVDAH